MILSVFKDSLWLEHSRQFVQEMRDVILGGNYVHEHATPIREQTPLHRVLNALRVYVFRIPFQEVIVSAFVHRHIDGVLQMRTMVQTLRPHVEHQHLGLGGSLHLVNDS